jgi:hypothetical protein
VTGWTRPARRTRAPQETPEIRKQLPTKKAEMDHEKPREKHVNSGDKPAEISPSGRVISYNVAEGERPGGIRVRFKIRIATGKRAQVIDARQAQVIMEVLQWQRQHRTRR